ncbi:hypothetical protein BD309DRAFT_2868 [Dichomitus squalens]|nr:hypothetical protein BD309DRAFT_2868 [Dichomitus squalens]
MSHLPPKPDFNYPARYPAEPRQYPRPPALPPAYPPTPERYGSRDRHVYPPRSPPRSRVPPPLDTYISPRPVVSYRSIRPPPPPSMDAYPSSYYDRRDESLYRDREYERRGEDNRLRTRDDDSRDRERDRDRKWEDEARRGYDGERRERDASRERRWARQKEEDRERFARRREDKERQEREWARLQDEDRRSGRNRTLEVEPERMWVPRLSRSPPRRMAP